MKKLPIILSAADHEELGCVIAAAGKLSERGRAEYTALQQELARATVVAPDQVPSDVVTMNSRAELFDLRTGERMEFTLVYPADADIEEGRISVLAPLGAAMLGYRVGDEFEWIVPYGRRRLKLTAVLREPDASSERELTGCPRVRLQRSSRQSTRPANDASRGRGGRQRKTPRL